jgi:hypothetical protein
MGKRIVALGVAMLFLVSPTISYQALADQSPVATSAQNETEGEKSEPAHRINEEREGNFEAIQLVLVGGAVVIAIALAYRAGRRRRAN